MADTIYTKDGKRHVLLGSTTPTAVIREQCGDDVIRAFRERVDKICGDITDLAAKGSINQASANAIYERVSALLDLFD